MLTILTSGLDRRINIDFLAEDFTVQDEAVVRCLQWFKLLHGGWQVTF